MKLSKELLSLVEAKNHLGETVYSTFPSWKAACKKQYPDVWFDGDIDICNAFVGTKPYKRGESKAVGEWDGNEGCMFIREDVEYAKKLVRGEKSGPGLMNKLNQFVVWKLLLNKDKTRFLPADQAVKQLKLAGFSDDQIHKIRDMAAEAGLAAAEYIKAKYPDKVPEKYVASMSSSFQVYDLFLNVGEDIRLEFQSKFQKLFDLKMSKAKDALKLKEGAVKDFVFGRGIAMYSKPGYYMFSVNMQPKAGPLSKEEASTYKLKNPSTDMFFIDSEDKFKLRMSSGIKESVDKEMGIGSTVHVTDGGEFEDSVGEVVRFSSDKKFVVVKLFTDKKEHTFHADDLTLEVEGNDVDEDEDEVDQNTFYVALYDEDEQTHWIGKVSKSGGTKWHETVHSGKADYRWGQSYMSYLTPGDVMTWINKDYGRGYDIAGPFDTAEEAEEHVEHNFGGQVNEAVSYTDFDDWKKAVLNSYPAQAKRIQFKGRFEGGKHTISAEIPNEDRSYGVWDGDKDKGVVLSEGLVKSVKSLASKIGKWLVSPALSKENMQAIKDLVGAQIKLEKVREDVMWSKIMAEMSVTKLELISKNREITSVARAAALKQISNKRRQSMKDDVDGEDEFGFTKDDYTRIWFRIEDLIGNIFPDGDPIDWVAPFIKKQGVSQYDVGNVIKKAANQAGHKDMYDYWNKLKSTYGSGLGEGAVWDNIKKDSNHQPNRNKPAVKSKTLPRDTESQEKTPTGFKKPAVGNVKPEMAIEGVDGETPTSFNDDDWYEYDPKTLVIKKRSGPTYYRAEQKLSNGNMVVRGMKAKRIGLKKE